MAAPPPPFFAPSTPGLGVGQSCPVCAPTAGNDTGGNWRMGTSCGFGGAGFVLFVLTIVKYIQGKRLRNAAPPAAMVAYTPAVSPAPTSAASTPAPATPNPAAVLPAPPAPVGYGYGYVAQPMLLVPSAPAPVPYAAPPPAFAYAAPPPPAPAEDDGSAAAAAYSAGFAAGAASHRTSTCMMHPGSATADSLQHASSYRSHP